MSRYLTGRRLFVLLASVILLIAVAGLTLGGQGRMATLPERVIMDVENTVSGWIYRPLSNLTAFFGGIHSLHEMYVENAELQTKMQNYESIKAQLSDANSQIQQLNTMVGYKQSLPSSTKLVPAHVTGRDPSEWNSELTIDAGSANGVQPEMAVVAADGSLVGRIDIVSRYSSKVVLITDTQLGDGVSALVQNGDTNSPFGIVVGSAHDIGQLEMTFWAPLVKVQPGNLVVTSGLSTIYPKGIIIGSISQVTTGAHNSAQSVIIAPAANLDYLQNVFVVKTTNGVSGR